MTQSITQLFDEIERYIARHHALLGEEQEEAMTALLPLGARLSQTALMLSEEEREMYAARLEEVVIQLDELTRLLQAKRDEVGAELQALSNVVRRANTAYRTTASSAMKDDE